MTFYGGTNNYGVLFKFDPINDSIIKLFEFGGANGYAPRGSLVEALNGNLYGLTTMGGSHGGGVIFEYNPVTNIYTKKIDFSSVSNGSDPEGSLMQVNNGKLYGLTSGGGLYGAGVLFEYNPITNDFVKKIDFNVNSSGGGPKGSLLQASDGDLYGLTTYGGSYNSGIIFKYNLSTNILTNLFDFNLDSTGYNASGTLMQAVNGNIYGTTCCGGTSNHGTLFEYNTQTDEFITKTNFNGINGKNPTTGPLIEIGGMVGIREESPPENIAGIYIYPNPFTTTTQISLNQTYHNITLAIYDIQGKLILQNEYADCDKIILNRNGLNNGMYFLRITLDGKWVETRKMLVSE